MKGEQAWRYNLAATGLILVACFIIFRLISIQFSDQGEKLSEIGKSYLQQLHTYYSARGQIYDRTGKLLAANEQMYEITINLFQVENAETVAFALSKILSNNPSYQDPDFYSEIYTFASQDPAEAEETEKTLTFPITQAELDQLIDWARRYASMPVAKKSSDQPSLAGLLYRPRPVRHYPEHTLAANILGYVKTDGTGVFGVEQKYNDLLAGGPQIWFVPIDPYQAQDLPDVPGGSDLILTLDREIQARVEQILDESLQENGSESGTIVVMDPQTGEILAMASTPRIDPNQYFDYEEIINGETPFNRAVSQTYEPGSVFKVLTMAAALDAGVITPESTYLDTGVIEIGGIYVYNWSNTVWGEQDMTGCLRHSINACLTWVAKQLGPTQFYEYMHRFNIGRPTGIDIAGEAPGIMRLPGGVWYESDLGTNAFGQGLTVTPVQMLMAVSALAYHGEMVMPHLMRSSITDGRQYNTLRTVIDTPIRAETARTITEMLATSLEEEASVALVDGYRIAGKTGTAQLVVAGGYHPSLTNASFVGWGPIDDPKFLIYIWFEKPVSSSWGSEVAAPVFSVVFKQLATLTGLPPDDTRVELAGH
jgi:cell division protein FtsI/penicillin-binding protein 2